LGSKHLSEFSPEERVDPFFSLCEMTGGLLRMRRDASGPAAKVLASGHVKPDGLRYEVDCHGNAMSDLITGGKSELRFQCPRLSG